MGWFRKKKQLPILTEEDSIELKELERKSYMEEARVLVVVRGKERAKQDLTIKKPDWDLS